MTAQQVPVVIRLASSANDYAAFGRICREYLHWCRARYADMPWFVEQVFGHQALDDELKLLAAKYGPPQGRTMLAERDGEIVAAGAFRRTSDTVCELKRLYVSELGRGLGLGRRITAALMDAAREDGFEVMQLDTSDRMAEATALYLSMGFQRIAPYQTYPEALMPHLVFMEARLRR